MEATIITTTNMVDTMIDDIYNGKLILRGDSNVISPAEACASLNALDDQIVPSDTKSTTASPSKTRDGGTSRMSTPRSTNQRGKVQTTKPPSSLMDQLELLMGQDGTGEVISPSKSPIKKKKPSSKKGERDDSNRETSSENNDALSSSERSSSKNKSSGSCTTRSKSELPKLPRSPQRKKKVISADSVLSEGDIRQCGDLAPFGELFVLDNNSVGDTHQTEDQMKPLLSPRRVKQAIKMRSDDFMTKSNEQELIDSRIMDATSERSIKSSSSTTRVRTRKIVSESGTKTSSSKSSKGTESPSDRATRSNSRLTKRLNTCIPSGKHDDKHSEQIENIEPSTATKQGSFRMEPISASPSVIESKLQIPGQMDMPIIASTGSESVASENDETAATPLLLRSCERSESLRQSTSMSTALSDDILDRLHSASLSDIEKSGIGVERSIKKTINNVRRKKNDTLAASLSCVCSSVELCSLDDTSLRPIVSNVSPDDGATTTVDTLIPTVSSQPVIKDPKGVNLTHSTVFDSGLPVENRQEFIVESDDSNDAKSMQSNASFDVDDEYIEEEVFDDERSNENSSAHLSQIAAEMDEAMTKIWAKFDEKVTKSTSEKGMITDSHHTADPGILITTEPTALVEQRAQQGDDNLYCNDNREDAAVTVIENIETDLLLLDTDLPIASIPQIADKNVPSAIVATTNEKKGETIAIMPKMEEENIVSAELIKSAFVALQKPDDTRLSSIVKLLVVDAWSSDIEKVTLCLDEMTTLCETDENAVAEMFQHGGHLVVIVLMRQHCENANVQIAALMTLQKAAECRNEFTDAIIALGALELIIATMKNHENNEDVVTAGCGALLNLTLPAKHAKVFVFELLGIQTISQVSGKFPTKIALQKYVLWMLQYFSYWENYKIQIVQQGGMQTLAKMIESFSSMINNHIDVSNDDNSSACNNDNKAAIESIVKSASATMKRLL